jgi:hypothetical protein
MKANESHNEDSSRMGVMRKSMAKARVRGEGK